MAEDQRYRMVLVAGGEGEGKRLCPALSGPAIMPMGERPGIRPDRKSVEICANLRIDPPRPWRAPPAERRMTKAQPAPGSGVRTPLCASAPLRLCVAAGRLP